MDMQEHIIKQLASMENISDRETLRDVFEQVFRPLYEETRKKYTALEQRIHDELPFYANSYSVCGTVASRKNSGRFAWLFPLLQEDLQKPAKTIQDIQTELKESAESVLSCVFIQADYLVCRELENSGTIFSGQFTVGDQAFSIGVKLRPTRRYRQCVEQLYRLFLSNGIPWATLNHPYLAKFFDVVCVRMDDGGKELPDGSGELQVDYRERTPIIKQDIVPVWNIQHMEVEGEDFPLPALDKVNYEYRFSLISEMVDDGYLVEYGSDRISAMRREKDALIVTSPLKSGLRWNMWRIYQRTPSETELFDYPLIDNRQADSFAGRIVNHFGTVIKTKAELYRILGSYAVSEITCLQDSYIAKHRTNGQTWEANEFIQDEIRDIDTEKTMVLRFKPAQKDFFLNRDIMSFLTSQVQLIYPEYYCVGVQI